MQNKFYGFLLGMLGILCISSCHDKNGRILNRNGIAIATVENPEKQPVFFFESDKEERLWTVASNFPNYRPECGQRILAHYTILDERTEEREYDHDVKLDDVYEILTKDLITIDESNKFTLGNDPIEIKDIWIGNDFLNVEFIFPGYNKVHLINLGMNETKEYDDEKIHLEFRHNANKDIATHRSWGMASFKIDFLKEQTEKDSLIIVVHSKPLGSVNERTDELIYRFLENNNDSRNISLIYDKGKIE